MDENQLDNKCKNNRNYETLEKSGVNTEETRTLDMSITTGLEIILQFPFYQQNISLLFTSQSLSVCDVNVVGVVNVVSL